MSAKLTPKMRGLLEMIRDHPYNQVDASGSDDDPVAPWCDDEKPTDTYNQAIEAGYIEHWHNSLFDSSYCKITDAGRQALGKENTDG